MQTRVHSRRRGFVLKLLLVLAAVVAVMLAALAACVYRTLTVDSTLRQVRSAVMQAIDVPSATRIEVNAWPALVGVARFGLSFAPLEPEARAALNSVRAAQTGIYELRERPERSDFGEMVARVDAVLERRQWQRAVAVVDRETSVMVYLPRDPSGRQIKAVVIVIDDRQLVIAMGRADLRPLMEMAAPRVRREIARAAKG